MRWWQASVLLCVGGGVLAFVATQDLRQDLLAEASGRVTDRSVLHRVGVVLYDVETADGKVARIRAAVPGRLQQIPKGAQIEKRRWDRAYYIDGARVTNPIEIRTFIACILAGLAIGASLAITFGRRRWEAIWPVVNPGKPGKPGNPDPE